MEINQTRLLERLARISRDEGYTYFTVEKILSDSDSSSTYTDQDKARRILDSLEGSRKVDRARIKNIASTYYVYRLSK